MQSSVVGTAASSVARSAPFLRPKSTVCQDARQLKRLTRPPRASGNASSYDRDTIHLSSSVHDARSQRETADLESESLRPLCASVYFFSRRLARVEEHAPLREAKDACIRRASLDEVAKSFILTRMSSFVPLPPRPPSIKRDITTLWQIHVSLRSLWRFFHALREVS